MDRTRTDKVSTWDFEKRYEHSKHSVSRSLFKIMAQKKSNLCFSADVETSDELLALARSLGPKISVLKTHIDILSDYTPQVSKDLYQIARESGFLIFEDRKFADIGQTVYKQYTGGLYRMAEWAHIVNAHAVSGPGILEGLRKGIREIESSGEASRGVLLLAEMSSKGNLMNLKYQEAALRMAKHFQEMVCGFIAQRRLEDSIPHFIYFTPGVHLNQHQDALGQQYRTPEQAIYMEGCDLIIVGRGITSDTQSTQMAERYRKAAWDAYRMRLSD